MSVTIFCSQKIVQSRKDCKLHYYTKITNNKSDIFGIQDDFNLLRFFSYCKCIVIK